MQGPPHTGGDPRTITVVTPRLAFSGTEARTIPMHLLRWARLLVNASMSRQLSSQGSFGAAGSTDIGTQRLSYAFGQQHARVVLALLTGGQRHLVDANIDGLSPSSWIREYTGNAMSGTVPERRLADQR